MAARGNYTLFKVRGIPIGVDWSWFLILFLVIWLLSGFYEDLLGVAAGEYEPYLLAVASALLFFGSILLHELGHALVALRNGIGISHITLWMFGGIAGLERDSESAGVEFRIAAAGPAVTAVIAALCFGIGSAINGEAFIDAVYFDTSGVAVSGPVALVAWLCNINLAILLFNLLPAFPLDGGRIARAIAWKVTGDRERATGFAARLGQGFAILFVAAGILWMFYGGLFGGLWLAVIGWMLGQSARAAVVRNELSRRIGDLLVADVMDAEPVAIPGDASIERALDEYFLRYQWPWFPVVDAGRRFVGLLKRGSADAVPEISRATQKVRELLDPALTEEQGVRDDAPLETLLGNTELRRLGALAAIDAEGRLSGVITLEQVGRALRDAVGATEGGRRA